MTTALHRVFRAERPLRLVGYYLARFPWIAAAQAGTSVGVIFLSFAVPEASSRILGTYVPCGDFEGAGRWLAIGIMAVVAVNILSLLQRRFDYLGMREITAILQRYAFQRCLALRISWHQSNGPANASRSFFYDISNLSNLAVGAIGLAAFPALQIAFVFGVMLYLNKALAIISLVPLVFLGVSTWVSFKRIPGVATEQIETANALGAIFYDYVSCVRLVKALGAERRAASDMRPRVEAAASAGARLGRLNALVATLSGLVVSTGGLVMLGIGLALLSREQITLTDLLRFLFFAALLYQPFEKLAHFGQVYSQARSSWMNMRTSLLNGPAESRGGRSVGFPRHADLVAEHVQFAYGVRDVLKSVCVRADEGELVGIVGRSGCGKTTLLSILAGYISPHRGTVRYGRQSLAAIDRHDLRAKVFYASQDALLFNRTIRFNLLMAKPDANEREMWEALERAGMREPVGSFAEGLDHIVGEHGALLSGGERQRMLVALAWLKNPRVLLLDEITAALDALTDRQVRKSIQDLMRGRTTVIVSHRLENVAPADRIYIMEDGAITAAGTHASLLEGSSLYKRLWDARAI